MKCIQLIKQVNNTELGKGGTHETYILVPQEVDVSDLFETIGQTYSFTDKQSHKEYKIRLTSAREKRIVGLGPFYRDNDLQAGDKVLVERILLKDGTSKYALSFSKSSNTVYFQKVKDYFEALTPERLSSVLDVELTDASGSVLKVLYHGEIKKRADSPSTTNVYNILWDGAEIRKNYQGSDIIGLRINNGQVKLVGFNPWEKYITEVAE
jgi:hypothetical protein